MDLQQYISTKYKGKNNWFMEEFTSFTNTSVITDVTQIRDYLDGQHKINNRPSFVWNGETVEPRKVMINLAKTILNFKTQYLLKNNVQLVGKERMLNQFNKINKFARFDDKNEKILSRMLKFGEVYEYLYIDNKGKITSKLIDADAGVPIYNRHNEMIGFIEHYIYDAISYYTVYAKSYVQEFSNEGGKVQLIASYPNLSGLPIVYKTENEQGTNRGKSELSDIINILDNMEDMLSKYADATYKFLNPIPTVIGQELKGTLSQEVVSGGLQLDDGADFKLVQSQMDYKTFESVYQTLQQALLDVSSTPAVSLNKTDISNLSEVSIKLLFSLADTAAGVYENFLIEGMYERWSKVVKLLAYQNVHISDDSFATLEFVFNYNLPANNKEVIENMKMQHEMGAISTETIVEMSPYIKDVPLEMSRLNQMAVPEDMKVKNEF